MKHIAIVGAGQAGASLAAKLRSLDFSGKITLIGDETALPYQRPPLSKKYLLGEMDLERLYLRPERFYQENDIRLLRGVHVSAIDREKRSLKLRDETIQYDELALTTGASPKALPAAIGGNLTGVYVMRTLADIDHIAPEFQAGRRVLVVGGGYIGLEAAAVAAKLGLKVTLIEMADRILQRVAAPETSNFFRKLHEEHGVEILENTGLERLLEGDPITARLSTGARLEVDFVIAGIGVTPNDKLASAAGVKCSNGIIVDRIGRTSDPHIWAAGDCAKFEFRGNLICLESVQNAIDQAEAVAANILGGRECYTPRPWFWSDQYDVKLQIAGLNSGYDQVFVRSGSSSRTCSHWYYNDGKLLAVDAMNDPRNYMIGKRLIDANCSPDPKQVADSGFELKSLL
ncbi:NAD(P)/FAD-dependent oxidoreductase [Ruegeria marina]|uniref:3-phenylpropionate/trans-cinnamate dioxygenase ferredoxin reductase subunit n=1 Tax=Ruegeria marina TaxID=639004 RepID=A0A1G6UZI4_9RHOB|nr:FAD-dependent oxidoreductase [Ruegeria marina]SDD46712.1 3-phenylpropionate/trans-cinnamate dioxygenase ferredoxin reductase subunit [Ruegeria marina]